MNEEGVLRFGHSPDADDAFMFYGFEAGGVRVEAGARKFRVEHLLEDIQSLNERALTGELEMTAISAHAYPFVADRYWIMSTGVSMGDGYGPVVVCRELTGRLEDLRGARIAVPGLMTTAMLVLKLFLPEFRPVVTPFDRILESVAAGEAEAGVIIHEGQLFWQRHGVHRVVDLGELWMAQTGLPLPLGLDVVRRDLGREVASAASAALRRSIEYARANREKALAYALQFGRGLDRELGGRFVEMYVNDWTLDIGDRGRRALAVLFDRAADAGLVPEVQDLVTV